MDAQPTIPFYPFLNVFDHSAAQTDLNAKQTDHNTAPINCLASRINRLKATKNDLATWIYGIRAVKYGPAAYGDQYAATEALKEQYGKVRASYMEHVKLARVALKNDAQLLEAFGIITPS